MTNSPASPSLGKWLAFLVVLLIVAGLLGAAALWRLLQPGHLLNRAPTPTAVIPPHAPSLEDSFGVPLDDEKQLVLAVNAGKQVTLKVKELWSESDSTGVSCATGFLAFTWRVRQPYPEGGEDLEFRRLTPQGDGRTEAFAGGSSGSATVGYCDEITLFNTSLTDYQVELRYASVVLYTPDSPALEVTEMPAPR